MDETINFALRKTRNNNLNLKIKQREAMQSIGSGRDTYNCCAANRCWKLQLNTLMDKTTYMDVRYLVLHYNQDIKGL